MSGGPEARHSKAPLRAAWLTDDYWNDGYAQPVRMALEIRKTPPPSTIHLSARQESEATWFDERYEPVVMNFASAATPPAPLGNAAARVCRYCEKSTPEVSFDTVSHAFPHMIGNEWLIDHCECDVCNKHFSKMLDDDFGAWTLPLRGMGMVEGKNGVPTLVSPDHKIRIEVDASGRRTITVKPGAVGLEIDEIAKTMTFPVIRPGLTPMGVFKSLVKMALAVMPPDDLARCRHLVKWIREEKHSFESFRFKPLVALTELVSGPIEPDQFVYALLRRKRSAPKDCPYMQFMLQFSNQVTQIALPMPKQDRLLMGKPVQLRRFPNPWATPDYAATYGAPFLGSDDLSSASKRRRGTARMSTSFDAIERTVS